MFRADRSSVCLSPVQLPKSLRYICLTTAFSALDFKTDVKLRKALADNIHDCTIIIVAQRISTILNADKIVVLDEGRIAGIGTHSELMENCEVYRQIAHSQLSQKDLAAIDNAKGGAVNA